MNIINAYFPFQPGFETHKGYQNYSINMTNPLYGLVTDFYQFQLKDSLCNSSIDVLPDACSDLFFQINNSGNKTPASVNGTTKSIVNVNLNKNTTFFGIRFYPGAIQRLFHFPAEELIDNEIPLIDILTEEQEAQILSIINESDCFETRITNTSAYFLEILDSMQTLPKIVSYSVDYIIHNSGNVRIDDLAEKTGYSARYLRKVFSQFVGLSPKEFCEIIRFQKSFNDYYSHPVSLCDLAAKYGYSDHAQMDKAYVKFSNQSPSHLIQYFFGYTSENHKTKMY